MENQFSLQGKNALVICPENSWGVDVVAGFVNAGAKVFLAGSDETYMANLVSDMNLAGFAVYDHETKEQTLNMLQTAVNTMGSVDIMVENSLYTAERGWEQSYELIAKQLKKTHLGMMLAVQAIGYQMEKQGNGSVILMADYDALAGCDPYNYQDTPERFDADFSLVKGFIHGGVVNYARQAAGFLGENGCRCNALACAPKTDNKAFIDAYLRHSHLKTSVTGEDVANAAVFLASDASKHITGITLPVDGGYTAK